MNIAELIQKIHTFYPLTRIMETSVRNFFEVKYNYNSNAIEWTTFTEAETIEVLRGHTIAHHVMREHLEVINHKKALDCIIALAKNPWEEIFNEKNILTIHERILTNIDDDYSGRYRNMNVRISGSADILPNHAKVPDLMAEFITRFIERYRAIDTKNVDEILRYGYDLHLEFVKIHPFIDGNGRTARLVMNLWFLANFSLIDVIYMTNRREYIQNIWSARENMWEYYAFMDANFQEFLEELLSILEDNIYYKI